MTTKLILTRHGHVDWIAPERFRGRADLALSNLGERQAKMLSERIASSWKPDMIYTSPLSRCVHTGAAISQATGARAEPLADLMDTDYGQWQGLTHEEVRSRWPSEFHDWFHTPELAAIPNGETLAAVLVRSVHVLQFVLKKHADQTIVLVGHDSTNRVILMHALGLSLSRYWRIKQEPCCINEIAIDDGVFTIHRINETHHLVGA
ncbi:histidine phosphatase family protein [Pseudomonas sp. ZM23]|jgi:broad specificity phosphatase PhoE|uniref:Histidine phosphatase family protein n=2 Tax=Pseudomonadota TaxID=1224 RepID=A0AAW7T224_BURVI|nr:MULTISPECIES: histidine phosphatase family protein [Pseudomonadota]MCP8477259.1 histidine phosphatase family protein [Pseudomonas triclosanedens]HEJ6533367.1 histidine phosphatase family protein [Pseudomonas aeruginosa]AOY95953.1 histidine phosphatase family protein [Cupriavidus sp. USMAA2-4]KLR58660.1 phosphoglycerate mutase [Diaphorobacter sp. J5-51]MCP8465960.1 histidine phosphatase family protein [Pseudomonas triclosanedens]